MRSKNFVTLSVIAMSLVVSCDTAHLWAARDGSKAFILQTLQTSDWGQFRSPKNTTAKARKVAAGTSLLRFKAKPSKINLLKPQSTYAGLQHSLTTPIDLSKGQNLKIDLTYNFHGGSNYDLIVQFVDGTRKVGQTISYNTVPGKNYERTVTAKKLRSHGLQKVRKIRLLLRRAKNGKGSHYNPNHAELSEVRFDFFEVIEDYPHESLTDARRNALGVDYTSIDDFDYVNFLDLTSNYWSLSLANTNATLALVNQHGTRFLRVNVKSTSSTNAFCLLRYDPSAQFGRISVANYDYLFFDLRMTGGSPAANERLQVALLEAPRAYGGRQRYVPLNPFEINYEKTTKDVWATFYVPIKRLPFRNRVGGLEFKLLFKNNAKSTIDIRNIFAANDPENEEFGLVELPGQAGIALSDVRYLAKKKRKKRDKNMEYTGVVQMNRESTRFGHEGSRTGLARDILDVIFDYGVPDQQPFVNDGSLNDPNDPNHGPMRPWNNMAQARTAIYDRMYGKRFHSPVRRNGIAHLLEGRYGTTTVGDGKKAVDALSELALDLGCVSDGFSGYEGEHNDRRIRLEAVQREVLNMILRLTAYVYEASPGFPYLPGPDDQDGPAGGGGNYVNAGNATCGGCTTCR